MTRSVFLGRQPIFDRRRSTYAYELLYRNDNKNVAFFSDPEDATRRVLEAVRPDRDLCNHGVTYRHGRRVPLLPPGAVPRN